MTDRKTRRRLVDLSVVTLTTVALAGSLLLVSRPAPHAAPPAEVAAVAAPRTDVAGQPFAAPPADVAVAQPFAGPPEVAMAQPFAEPPVAGLIRARSPRRTAVTRRSRAS